MLLKMIQFIFEPDDSWSSEMVTLRVNCWVGEWLERDLEMELEVS